MNDLYKILSKEYPYQCERVLNQLLCDIEPCFLGFTEIYYYLSKIIPKDWTVIDFGCAYAPQAYYFRYHKKYIGIDYSDCEKFQFKNGKYLRRNINFPNNWEHLSNDKTFAICNYVPINTEKIRKSFKNLYVFYPE